jgi:excisionase family DNA binding protein
METIDNAKPVKKLKIENRTSVTWQNIANRCLVSEITVRRWIKHGKLPAFRLPSGQYRVTAEDFQGFLKQFGM